MARRTMAKLLELGVVPIVNENDALASNEIRFGDNDRLSALIANMVRADALILLTDVDALYTAPPSEPGSHRIGFVPNITELLDQVRVGGSESGVGTGGMVTKLEAARMAAVSGIPAVLTAARNAGPALMGDEVGTAFAPVKQRGSARRLWIKFAAHPRGVLVADSGAAKAVRGGRASLLAAGVLESRGDFAAGDRCGSTTRRAIIWRAALPVTIPRRFRICSDATPHSCAACLARNMRTRSCTATISCSCDCRPGASRADSGHCGRLICRRIGLAPGACC